METQQGSLSPRLIPQFPSYAGPLVLSVAILAVLLFLIYPTVGVLLAMGLLGFSGVLLALRWPALCLVALWLVAPFNYGLRMPGAVIKLNEFVIMAMGGLILLRLGAGDPAALARLRRSAGFVIAAALLGVLAIVTAIPHPHVFNVRYELFNYVAFIFMLLFFRRSWWPLVVGLFLATMVMESLAALGLKFIYGYTGYDLFREGGGIDVLRYTTEDIEAFAGGRFRLAGTLGHKNMLAAFYVLMLPLVTLEMLRRARFSWLLVILPALVVLGMTDSATGWGATLLVVALALVHLRRFDYFAVVALVLLPIAAYGLYEFGDTIFYRMHQLFGRIEGRQTLSARMEIFGISMHLLREYPLFGIGRLNFMEYGETYYTHAHNMFLMKMIEMGIPAGLAFTGFIIAALGRGWWAILREARRLAAQRQYYYTLGLWLGCIGFVAMNVFDYNYVNFSLGPMFLAALGIILTAALDLETDERT